MCAGIFSLFCLNPTQKANIAPLSANHAKKPATHADREICALFVEINCKLARKTVKKAAGLSNAAWKTRGARLGLQRPTGPTRWLMVGARLKIKNTPASESCCCLRRRACPAARARVNYLLLLRASMPASCEVCMQTFSSNPFWVVGKGRHVDATSTWVRGTTWPRPEIAAEDSDEFVMSVWCRDTLHYSCSFPPQLLYGFQFICACTHATRCQIKEIVLASNWDVTVQDFISLRILG